MLESMLLEPAYQVSARMDSLNTFDAKDRLLPIRMAAASVFYFRTRQE